MLALARGGGGGVAVAEAARMLGCGAVRLAHTAAEKERKEREDAREYYDRERRRALLTHFKSVANLASATQEELCTVEGIGKVQAKTIWEYYHQKPE